MEQLYMVEIFIDRVTIFVPESEENKENEEGEELIYIDKKLIIKVKFGPKIQFIIKEGQLAATEGNTETPVETNEQGKKRWSKTVRAGKSYMFPSYSDTVLVTLSKFPLEIEVWNDDKYEVETFVGIGTMHWDTEFFHMLKETSNAHRLHEPLTIKQSTHLNAECCCKRVGKISFILRISALGESIVTEFQQLMHSPDEFVFRTNKAPSMFKCIRVEGDDPNFCMVGSLYETATLEDPDLVKKANVKIDVCTEAQSCAMKADENVCQHGDRPEEKKKYAIDKIKMGDIVGPCGNINCLLAHKVRNYIRKLDTYKKQAGEITFTKDPSPGNVCGRCICKDDRWHREKCPAKPTTEKAKCSQCGGTSHVGETCRDEQNKQFGTGATPIRNNSKTVMCVTQVPNFKESMFGRQFTIQNLIMDSKWPLANEIQSNDNLNIKPNGGCCCQSSVKSDLVSQVIRAESTPNLSFHQTKSLTRCFLYNPFVYNVDVKPSKSQKIETFDCNDIPPSKECKCAPTIPKPPCKTFNCNCLVQQAEKMTRKLHKPYCPTYKHKENCPVLEVLLTEEEELLKKKQEEEDEEAEPLPYGLPPVRLGPCPVLGRPCTVPDGFARMYKTGAMAKLPPSYSDAGKVCCSKEYERIKKAIGEYLKKEKEHDFRCVNAFNVDTERRCCDKEQVLLSMMGKECCGAHKLGIQDKFKKT